MPTDPNPYLPPRSDNQSASWWSRLLDWLVHRGPDFAKGDAVIVGGIAYFIDPGNKATLYAGSPSDDISDEKLKLVAKEAIRYLPDFLAEYDSSSFKLRNRRFVVRIVESYLGAYANYNRAVEVAPAPLSDVIDNVKKS